MITKKVYYTDILFCDVYKSLFNSNIEEKRSSITINLPKSIRVGIVPLKNGTRITVSRRPDRDNQIMFLSTIQLVEHRLPYYFSTNSYGKLANLTNSE